MPYKNKEDRKAFLAEYNQRPEVKLKRTESLRKFNKKVYEENKEACLARVQSWRKENPDKVKAYSKKKSLKQLYNITLDQYNQMLAEQNGVCKICEQAPGTRALHVDHNHKTGKIRGLLCHFCNTSLGGFKDDTNLLTKAIEYLNEST